MARVQAHLGESVPLPPFFSGHGPDGMPARSEQHPHLFFLFDPDSSRLMILAPHFVDRREPNEEERRHLHDLQQAMNGFNELRAGAMGCLRLRQITVDPKTDPLFAPARVWDSITPYTVTRHMKLGSATHALATDLYAECDRRGLPTPSVIPQDIQGIPGVGLNALVRLIFPEPIPGPMILGRRRYIGGGVFMAHLTME
jgi:CRISPR-associated protein Csb2